jgi:guanine nucleotide-binding protein G(i) subunit alpha
MGACSSAESLSPEEAAKRKAEKDRSKNLEAQMSNDHTQDQQINKLLLLGAGESGKSTLFKQMITIYGKGYPESERRTFTPIIHNNIITSMKTLCQQVDHWAPGQLHPQLIQSKQYIENELKGDEEIDSRLGEHIAALWRDSAIQQTYQHRSSYQLTDSASYFFDRIVEISDKNYVPSEQDVLRSRVRTTGIVENEFSIDGNAFKMFDVGGQRNERKKWIHCFENVTAVLFVAAISEYDQVLYEDENTNRITEALMLFEEICNSRWFRETSMILFLNKCDLFRDKLQSVPLSQFFGDYQGDESYENGCQFMQNQFESKNRNPDKTIYTHITCATDTNNISAVFNAVKDIIIRKSLNEAGLV